MSRAVEPSAAAAPHERVEPGSIAKVLVVLTDPLSGIISKGAVVARYYNPGDLFREVHFLLLNDDKPDPASLQFMVGKAKPVMHNLPLPPRLFVKSLGWQPALMQGLLDGIIEIARTLEPNLVRAYCAGLNALLATRAARALGIPSLVSVHSRPDYWVATSWRSNLREAAIARLADRVVREAENVLAIYNPQLSYFERLGIAPVIIRNVIATESLAQKTSYAAGPRLQVISVGRHMPGKDISVLLRAVAGLPDIDLTVMGDGPLHGKLVGLAREVGLGERCRFVTAMPNPEVCAQLHRFDVFAAHTTYPETPKAVMEPMLAGLPVILNRPRSEYRSELTGATLLVEDSVEGYRAALVELRDSARRREEIGLAGRRRALELWEPAATERKHAALHARLAR